MTSLIASIRFRLYRGKLVVVRLASSLFLRFIVPASVMMNRKRLIPISLLLSFHTLVSRTGTPHALKRETKVTPGSRLNNRFLAQNLSDVLLGASTLECASLDFLEQRIALTKPSSILEFGSGVSTVCLCQYMREVHGSGERLYVLSIEQDPHYAEQTRDLLRHLGLDQYGMVIHAPIGAHKIDDIKVNSYILEREVMDTIRLIEPELILVDGPAGGGLSRVTTLPLLMDIVGPDVQFYLDDIYRDWELEVINHWMNKGYVKVCGFLPTNKGLLAGKTLSRVDTPIQRDLSKR